jgi:hypothetical protein
MGQQLQSRRPASSQNAWLSALVDTMEKFSRPEVRAVACDRRLVAAARAQLFRPAPPCVHRVVSASLRP